MAPYSRRAGSSSAAMTCGPAGPCFGGDRSEGRGRGPQVRARPKLLAEVEARGLGRGFAEGGGLELVAGSIPIVSPLPGVLGGFGFVVLFFLDCCQQPRCLAGSNDRTRCSSETGKGCF